MMKKKILLVKFLVILLGLNFTLASEELGVNFPNKLRPSHHTELFTIRKKTGILNNNSWLRRFIQVGEADYKKYKPYLNGKSKVVIKEVLKRAKLLLTETDDDKRIEIANQITELAAGYYNYKGINYTQFRKDNPRIGKFPFFRAAAHRYWSQIPFYKINNRGRKPLYTPNLARENGEFYSLDELEAMEWRDHLDPKESLFWKKRNLSKHETYTYHEDKHYKKYCKKGQLYYYKRRKTQPEMGGGYNPGVKFYIIDKKGKKKRGSLKFNILRPMDQNLEPFFATIESMIEVGSNALYKAWGFNVDKTYFCHNPIRFRYTPELLRLTFSEITEKDKWDSMYLFPKVELTDGTILPFKTVFKQITTGDGSNINPNFPYVLETRTHHLRPEYKGKVFALLTNNGAHIEHRSKNLERINYWGRGRLSHLERREVRGLLLFDAFVGNLDNFAYNLKIIIKKGKDKTLPYKMKFILADNGDTLNPSYISLKSINGFLPLHLRKLVEAQNWAGYQRALIPYKKLTDLEIYIRPLSWTIFQKGKKLYTPKWFEMTEEQRMETVNKDLDMLHHQDTQKYYKYAKWEDLRWAARKIASLSEEHFLHAYAMSGLGYPGAKLIAEKFIARRDELIIYFGLEGEYGLLRPNGPNKKLTVSGDGTISVKTKKGGRKIIKVPSNGNYVIDGVFYDK